MSCLQTCLLPGRGSQDVCDVLGPQAISAMPNLSNAARVGAIEMADIPGRFWARRSCSDCYVPGARPSPRDLDPRRMGHGHTALACAPSDSPSAISHSTDETETEVRRRAFGRRDIDLAIGSPPNSRQERTISAARSAASIAAQAPSRWADRGREGLPSRTMKGGIG